MSHLTEEQIRNIVRTELLMVQLLRIEAKLDMVLKPKHKTSPPSLFSGSVFDNLDSSYDL